MPIDDTHDAYSEYPSFVPPLPPSQASKQTQTCSLKMTALVPTKTCFS